mmetsp:Transcript_21964/g.55976  ORF Transcript_21964/g.55976 Transcript_21964/m.55976 type:complete len:281 (-) Transcript_21964:3110-3952(-)
MLLTCWSAAEPSRDASPLREERKMSSSAASRPRVNSSSVCLALRFCTMARPKAPIKPSFSLSCLQASVAEVPPESATVRSTFACVVNAEKLLAFAGNVICMMTLSLSSKCRRLETRFPRSSCSQRARSRSAALGSTSICRIGTSFFANAPLATSKCWSTAALMPSESAATITDRTLMPTHPKASALSKPALTRSRSFIRQTPRDWGIRPVSIRRKGITFLTSHRYLAHSILSKLSASISSGMTQAITREPLNTELVMMRLRIVRASVATIDSLSLAPQLP